MAENKGNVGGQGNGGLRQVLQKTDRAFGTDLKDAKMIMLKRNVSETIRNAKEKVRESWQRTSIKRIAVTSPIGITLIASYPVATALRAKIANDHLKAVNSSMIVAKIVKKKGCDSIMEYRAMLTKERQGEFDELVNDVLRKPQKHLSKDVNKEIREYVMNMKVSKFKGSLTEEKREQFGNLITAKEKKVSTFTRIVSVIYEAFALFFIAMRKRWLAGCWAINTSIQTAGIGSVFAGVPGGAACVAATLLVNAGIWRAVNKKW